MAVETFEGGYPAHRDPGSDAGEPRARAALGRIRTAAGRIVDLVLPERCASCGSPGTGHGLCGSCWSRVDFIAPPICQRLGTPFAYDPGEPVVSPAALADPPDFDRARAVARYDGPARAMVRSLKFQDRMELAALMAGMMVRSGRELLEECDVVVPIPLHRRRLFGRRFNQAAVLAARIAERAGRDHAPMAVERVKPTRHQVGLSANERRRNVAGAFRVPVETRPLVEGRRVVLVDDVLTTGATANACARACRRAGAAGVDVLVFARVAAQV